MKKVRFFLAAVTILCLQLSWPLLAHDGHPHNSTAQTHTASQTTINANNPFPSIHPMIVHFPIVLLILAAILQLVGMFVYQSIYHYTITAVLAVATFTAWLASNTFHAHTGPMPPEIEIVLQQHEVFAAWTVWLSTAALLLKIIACVIKRPAWRTFTQWGTLLVLLLVAACVSIAGHYGAALVHKYGVGPQGRLLEQHVHQH
ncbi:hypothetical protein KTO58_10715 [Chitinophaga pendula]|uniref:DUF2231 domain-containing protein n=1 Tax=Chitinophaga TaxID=79328 RepID=UPI000BAF37D9|nr:MULTISPECIES: DUF2231 domain-containing protein [Chitinophaga]ASZ12745.1 hypothetical protein CK934_18185 [Chitinophaga sp. MD30]UCJ09635.1 hypothetical protein KTO58_10715 [Chitinophaga pendula]